MEPRTCDTSPKTGGIPGSALAGEARSAPHRASRGAFAMLLVVLLASTSAASCVQERPSSPAAVGGPSPVIGRVPAAAVLFAEARLDLPGDQAANVKALLDRFPVGSGPTSSSSLADDVSQVLSMADGVYAWSLRADVSGWVGKDIALALVSGSTPARQAGVLALVDVADAEAALAWLRARATAAELPVPATTTYHGTTVMVERTGDAARGADEALAAVLDGRVLVVGRSDAVHAAIDTTPATSLASSAGFVAAREALGGDAVAAAYLDVRGLAQKVPLGYAPTGEAGLSVASELLATMPDWIALRLRAEPNVIRLDKANPPTTGGTPRKNVEDVIAKTLPAGTLEVIDLHDLGLEFQAYVDFVRSTTSTQSVRDIERTLEVVGGMEALLAQVGTVDLVTVADGDRLLAGVVAAAPDAAAAGRLIEAIAAWARSSGYAVTTEDHAGVTITDIDLATTWSLAGERPFIQLASWKGLFVAGFDRGFTPAILDVDPAASLATQPRYQRVMALAGTPNTESCYADLAGMLAVADRQAAASGDLSAIWQREVRPWLAPLDLLACATVAGSPDRASIVIALREPAP